MTRPAARNSSISKLIALVATAGMLAVTGAAAQAAAPAPGAPAAHLAAHKKHKKHKKHKGHKAHKKHHGRSARHRRRHHHSAPAISIAPARSPRAAIVAPAVPAGPCPDADLEPTSANLAAVSQATICLINKERVSRGLIALAESAQLDSAATHHSADMIAGNYFEHVSPSGETPERRVLATGYVPPGSGYELGENIATGSTTVDTPAQMVVAWMNSPEHRANILNGNYRETGVSAVAAMPAAYANGLAGSTYTQEFGVISTS